MTQLFLSSMIGDDLPTSEQLNTLIQKNELTRNIQQDQTIIYNFLLTIVKQWYPSDILKEFKNLFINHVSSDHPQILKAVYEIVLENDEKEFRNTLKRSCYILINNWYVTRQYQAIKELINLFEDPKVSRKTLSPTLERWRNWILNFISSKDYEELKLFVAKHDSKDHWTSRFTSYLLVPQYVDPSNSEEQRQAARIVSQQLKNKFKFDLAMYTARSQSAIASEQKLKNPTGLGDELLRLIKIIMIRRGPFSHANLAHIFVEQNRDVKFKDFKGNIIKYLCFAIGNKEFVNVLSKNLAEKIEGLYTDRDEEIVDNSLIFRTCNRLIEYLITENKQEPSYLFILLLTQGNSLNLVVILVKLVLICQHIRSYLEACIAAVIRYYEKFSEEECQWVITFLEVFNITFAIYAEDVEYTLVQMRNQNSAGDTAPLDLDAYRIFSQFKEGRRLENYVEEPPS